MKKITLNKRKFAALLLLTCLLLGQSCRKEVPNFTGHEEKIDKQQLIKEEVLLKFIQNNKAIQLLNLDWKRAQQNTIGNKNVVRIPTLPSDNLDRLYQSKDLQLKK